MPTLQSVAASPLDLGCSCAGYHKAQVSGGVNGVIEDGAVLHQEAAADLAATPILNVQVKAKDGRWSSIGSNPVPPGASMRAIAKVGRALFREPSNGVLTIYRGSAAVTVVNTDFGFVDPSEAIFFFIAPSDADLYSLAVTWEGGTDSLKQLGYVLTVQAGAPVPDTGTGGGTGGGFDWNALIKAAPWILGALAVVILAPSIAAVIPRRSTA